MGETPDTFLSLLCCIYEFKQELWHNYNKQSQASHISQDILFPQQSISSSQVTLGVMYLTLYTWNTVYIVKTLWTYISDIVEYTFFFYIWLLASDQPLWAELEVLLPSFWYGQLRHSLRGGAAPHQETLLGNVWLPFSEGTTRNTVVWIIHWDTLTACGCSIHDFRKLNYYDLIFLGYFSVHVLSLRSIRRQSNIMSFNPSLLQNYMCSVVLVSAPL